MNRVHMAYKKPLNQTYTSWLSSFFAKYSQQVSSVMCNRSLNIKSEIVEKLNFLVESSLQKNTEQGVFTFTSYIERLNKSDNNSLIYEELYSELSSMQRFASFDRQEWLEIQGIFRLIEQNR